MHRFFATNDEGFVNPAHVVKVVMAESRDCRLLLGEGGVILGAVPHAEAEHLWWTILPAAAGACATVVTVCPAGEARPERVECDRRAVVAWRVSPVQEGFRAWPITAGEAPEPNKVILIEHPGGQYEWTWGREFADLEEAKKSVLQEFQRNWDIKHIFDRQCDR
jgi:hypothetical protein